MLDLDVAPLVFKAGGEVFEAGWPTMDDAAAMAQFGDISVPEQVAATCALIAAKARPRSPEWWRRVLRRPSPVDAVRALPVHQQSELAAAWFSSMRGEVTPGES